MMQRFNQFVTQLIYHLFPRYKDHLLVARTSYRPTEIYGRIAPSYKKDDTRLHVDAFPATPVQGRRILRVFSNINPKQQARVWRVGEPFEKVVQRFLPKINHPFINGKILQKFKITKGLRTRYDHIMLQLHDRMKADEVYQREVAQVELPLPASSTWIVQTDVVSHAALAGQFVLEQTFYLPIIAMQNQNLSPLRMLEKQVGKFLV